MSSLFLSFGVTTVDMDTETSVIVSAQKDSGTSTMSLEKL